MLHLIAWSILYKHSPLGSYARGVAATSVGFFNLR